MNRTRMLFIAGLAFALSVVEKVLQPLVGIAFVVLYLDSRLEPPSHVEPIVRAGEGDAVR